MAFVHLRDESGITYSEMDEFCQVWMWSQVLASVPARTHTRRDLGLSDCQLTNIWKGEGKMELRRIVQDYIVQKLGQSPKPFDHTVTWCLGGKAEALGGPGGGDYLINYGDHARGISPG